MVCFIEVPAPKELSMFTATSMVVLSIVATIGNLSVVITIIKDPLSKLRSPFNYFLLNLALSDLFLGVVCMPMGVVGHIQEYMEIPDITVARAIHMSIFISGTASLLSLITLAIDRLIAITLASKHKGVFTFQRCVIICICIWIFSLSFPLLYFAWKFIGYMMFFTHSAIFVALVIIVIVQIRIKKFLQLHCKNMVQNVSSSAPQKSSADLQAKELLFQKKMSRVYFVILCFFVGIYIPAVVMGYILHFCETCDCKFRHVLRDCSFLLVSSNSCVNPFIYAIRVKRFRMSARATFCKGRRCEVSHSSSADVTTKSKLALK